MARKLRVQYEGAIYHVMNRGDRREPIFLDDEDRLCFLKTYEEACQKTGWITLAYVLMGNHFHLVIETPQANLVLGMKWFLSTYTSRFNRRHKLFGHLFSGRYKAIPVDGSGSGYLATACDYVHLNPVRAGLVPDQQPLESYPWSSYPAFLKPPKERPVWLSPHRLFGEHRIPKDSAAGRREFARHMEMRRFENNPVRWKALRRGWCLGSDEFKEELLAAMEGKSGENHDQEIKRESEEQRARKVVERELKAMKWTEQDLATTPKCHPRKVEVAKTVREETTMTMKWIAENLHMGTRTNVASLIYQSKVKGRG